jgi:hypothetical protein
MVKIQGEARDGRRDSLRKDDRTIISQRKKCDRRESLLRKGVQERGRELLASE